MWKILGTGVKGKVPVTAPGTVGLRPVMSTREAEDGMDVFRVAERAVGNGPWNRRQRAYNEMIRSGSPYEIAKVLRDLYRIKYSDDKDLSYGERRLMDQARGLLVKELALSKQVTEADVEREIESVFAGAAKAS